MSTSRYNIGLPALLLITFVVGILCALGVWQLQRLQEKEALIAAYEQARAAPPVPIQHFTEAELAAQPFRRVLLAGRFLHDKTLYLGGRSYARETGYELLTPMQLPDGRNLLVNRGWVPSDKKDPKTRPETVLSIMGRVIASVKAPSQPGMFTPENHPKKNFWFFIDRPAMEKQTGLKFFPVTFEVVDEAVDPHRLPVAGDGKLHTRNDHLGYALTWFGLALAALGVFIAYHRQKAKAA